MRIEDRNRDSAPGRALVAVGGGLAAIAAVRLLPPDARLVSYMLIPALTLVLLWVSTTRLPAAPPGTRKAGYGLVAVLGTMACIFVPLSLLIGPVRVLAAALLIFGVRQRDPRQIVPALILMVIPIEVAITEVWSGLSTAGVLGQVVTSLAFLLAGTWGMFAPGGGDSDRPAEVPAAHADGRA